MKNKAWQYCVGIFIRGKSVFFDGFNIPELNSWPFRLKWAFFTGILLILIMFAGFSCGCVDDEPDTGKGSDACRDYSGICSCAGNCYDCQDFYSKSDAQDCYDYCMSIGKGDVHGIDKDSDGVACNSLLEEDTQVREEPVYKNPDSMTKHDSLSEG